MKAEFDITKVVEEIAMQAKENQEEFIFETIRPYCENILQTKINKEELKQILLNGMRKQQPCEDCISGESVIEWLKDKDIIKTKNQEENARRELAELPSVTPSYNSIKTELDHVIDEIIIRIEQTRDKDKLCEYPYNRCIDIVREVLG